jgi:hypothetical protein
LIPFDDRLSRLFALKDRYCFNVITDIGLLAACDDWSKAIHGRILGQYRKLAAWGGPFEEFAYIDVDTVLMQPISSAFGYLQHGEFVSGHSNVSGSRRFVWKDPNKPEWLTAQEYNFAAGTGFFLSRRSALAIDCIPQVVREAIELREHLVLECAEQSFLNLAVVRLLRSYTSFYILERTLLKPDCLVECWAGDNNWTISGAGECRYAGEPKNVLLIHWAGEWAPLGWDKIVVRIAGFLRVGKRGVRRKMKLGHIWRKWRASRFRERHVA